MGTHYHDQPPEQWADPASLETAYNYALFLKETGETSAAIAFLFPIADRYLYFMLPGLIGAAPFYGDAILTPAISVLSAVEGLEAMGTAEAFAVLELHFIGRFGKGEVLRLNNTDRAIFKGVIAHIRMILSLIVLPKIVLPFPGQGLNSHQKRPLPTGLSRDQA